MKDRYLQLFGVSTVLASLLVSVLVCFAMRQNIASIDLIKVLNAQASYANRLIEKNPKNSNWINITSTVNKSIREKVKLIAGKDTIVLVSPAIIQGHNDITDRVLLSLGLPIPRSIR